MKLALALFLLLTTIGCDRVTKHIATTQLRDQPSRSWLGGTVELEYAENRGAFLSMGSRLPEWASILVFRVGVGIALAALAFVALKYRWTGAALAGAVFIFAGGISNLFDRTLHGSVVDFMSIGIGPLRTGIFNVADAGILRGGVLIAFRESFQRSQT